MDIINIRKLVKTYQSYSLTVNITHYVPHLFTLTILKLFSQAVNGGIQIDLNQIFPSHSNLAKILISVLDIDTSSCKSVLLKERRISDAVSSVKMLAKDLFPWNYR